MKMTKEQRPTLKDWVETKVKLEDVIFGGNEDIIRIISDYLEAHKEPVEEEPAKHFIADEGKCESCGKIYDANCLTCTKDSNNNIEETYCACDTMGHLAPCGHCENTSEEDLFKKETTEKLPEVGRRYKTILHNAGVEVKVKSVEFGRVNFYKYASIALKTFWEHYEELPKTFWEHYEELPTTKESPTVEEDCPSEQAALNWNTEDALTAAYMSGAADARIKEREEDRRVKKALEELKREVKQWKREVFNFSNQTDEEMRLPELNLCAREVYEIIKIAQNLVNALESNQSNSTPSENKNPLACSNQQETPISSMVEHTSEPEPLQWLYLEEEE